MDKTKNHATPVWWFIVVAVIGVAARLLAATRGHNADVDAYLEVAKILDHGGNVYASTPRYNYGPVWFWTLHGLDCLARHDATVFRYFVSAFLSLVDVGIFAILLRRFGKLAAALFFLNPVSILITGYHSQFDNFAIFLGMLAVWLVGDQFDQPLGRRKFAGLLVLGISLATKHLLFAFPFWLAVKQKGLLQKLAVLAIPSLVFLAGFIPYWHVGEAGIIQNVFDYRSFKNEYFYTTFVPLGIEQSFNSQQLWFLLLALFAFVYRLKDGFESLLLYTAVMVGASPAIVNQYLTIPVAFIATHVNIFTILYTAMATVHLLLDGNGLHLFASGPLSSPDLSVNAQFYAIFSLWFAVIWITWKQSLTALIEKCAFEVKHQFGLKK